jgi:putative oxidoreductase
LRLGVGLIFAVHGAQKVFGWWGGSGFTGWEAVVSRMGFRPTRLFAALSAGAELVGGLALALGVLTPLAAMVLVGQSVVIIFAAHWPRGFFNRDNGYEFPLSLVSSAIAVLLLGPGEARQNAVAIAANRPDASPWLTGSTRSTVLDVFGATPATRLAEDWLADDLNQVGWLARKRLR